jgi:hypothetical protein
VASRRTNATLLLPTVLPMYLPSPVDLPWDEQKHPFGYLACLMGNRVRVYGVFPL